MVRKKTILNDESKLFAVLAVLLSIVGFLIAFTLKKDDKYIMFYAKQSLVLFIFGLILSICGIILSIITFGFGLFIFMPITKIIWAILWIFQIVYSLSGKEKETPIIGQYAKKFNF